MSITTFEDTKGDVMQLGDKIIFTRSSDRAGDLHFGEIIAFTKKNFKVRLLNPDLSPKMKRVGYYTGTGKFYPQNQWEINAGYQPREIQEFIQTGEEELESLVPHTDKDRFYIMP